MAKRHTPGAGQAPLPLGTHTVTDLAQVRALADPLRLRILGALGGVPRTTKQVAGLLGEKPTKLYHHVEALERVGLIRLQETRPNRGTVEKYYQAVAAQFKVAASALSPAAGPGEEPSAGEAMLTSILDTARKELVASLCPGPAGRPGPEEAPLVARVTVVGSRKKVQAVRRRLLRWIEKLRAAEAEASRTGGQGGQGEVSCTFTVVFCRTTPT
jgi:DNA-binding transcriptional ArsR family regulator